MTNPHALLLLNPVSGMRTSMLALNPIVKALSAQGCDTTVHLTTHAGDATDYARLHGGDYSRILVCGGDGTLSEVFRGLIAGGHDVPVGYIPTGFPSSNCTPLSVRSMMPPMRVELEMLP